jgi:hypothetical protein
LPVGFFMRGAVGCAYVRLGLESTLGNKFSQVIAFLGEDYDLQSLPAPKPVARRTTSRCQFQRDGDFMVCQICGWRMRISDPSLAPEKYHARCGGAEARADYERRLARPSISRQSSGPKSPAKKRRTFQLGTFVAQCLKKFGIKRRSGCDCGRREETLNRWGQRMVALFWRKPL